MSSEDELWKSGKSDDNTAEISVEEDDTLDLSSPSPEVSNDSDLDLRPLAISKEDLEDSWTPPPVIPNEIGISMRAIGVIAVSYTHLTLPTIYSV